MPAFEHIELAVHQLALALESVFATHKLLPGYASFMPLPYLAVQESAGGGGGGGGGAAALVCV